MTDRSRVPADDDPRRQTDEAADQDVAAAERVVADHDAGTTPPGVINDAAVAEADARVDSDTASLDSDPLSERNLADPAFDAGPLGPTSDHLAEDEPGLEEKVAAAAGAAATGDIAVDRGTATGAAAGGAAASGAVAGGGSYIGTRRATPGRGMGHVAEHETDDWWRTWLGRTTVVLGSVLVLATAMVWSWVGGLHAPQPKNIKIAVIATDVPAQAMLAGIRNNTQILQPASYATAKAASDALNKRRVNAILASDALLLGGGLNLTVASGAGPGIADAVATTIESAAQNLSVPLAVEDAYPFSSGDSRGLTPFWLMLAWILGGLLAAIVLGVAVGTVPRDLDRLGMRLGALAVFSLLLGLLGALFAGPILGVWHQHTFGLWLAGSLITFTAALITSALQSWLGLWGVGIAAVLLLVLGVPGSGGAVAGPFLPGFFRGMPKWLPNGLGTDLIRGVEYFGRSANTWPITGLTLWSLASILALLGATTVLGKQARVHAASPAPTTVQPATAATAAP